MNEACARQLARHSTRASKHRRTDNQGRQSVADGSDSGTTAAAAVTTDGSDGSGGGDGSGDGDGSGSSGTNDRTADDGDGESNWPRQCLAGEFRAGAPNS